MYFGTPSGACSIIVDRLSACFNLHDVTATVRRIIGSGIEHIGRIGTNDDGSWALKATLFSRRSARQARALLSRAQPWGSAVKVRLGRAREHESASKVLSRNKCAQLLNTFAPLAWSSTVLSLRSRPNHVVRPTSAQDASSPQAADALGLYAMGGATFRCMPADAFDDKTCVADCLPQCWCNAQMSRIHNADMLPAAVTAESNMSLTGLLVSSRPPQLSTAHLTHDGSAGDTGNDIVDRDADVSDGWGQGSRFVHLGFQLGPPTQRPPAIVPGLRRPRLVPIRSHDVRGAASTATRSGTVLCVTAQVEVRVTNPDGSIASVVGTGGCDCTAATALAAGGGSGNDNEGMSGPRMLRSLSRNEVAERLARLAAAEASRERVAEIASSVCDAALSPGASSSSLTRSTNVRAWAAVRDMLERPQGSSSFFTELWAQTGSELSQADGAYRRALHDAYRDACVGLKLYVK